MKGRNEQILLQKDTLLAKQYGFASAVINSLAFAVYQKYLSCYYTTSYWHKFFLWVIKDSKTNNEPAFWTSIIQLKVNPEPNNHN